MASIRPHVNAHGETSYAVLFRLGGKQKSVTFQDPGGAKAAAKFKEQIARLGAEAAFEVFKASGTSAGGVPTVAELMAKHIDSLYGIEPGTISDYRSYLRLNFEAAPIGALPADTVSEDDVGAWVKWMLDHGYSGKTIRNRHSLLSATMGRAVKKKYRGDNPAKGAKMPETQKEDPVFLTHGEFVVFLNHFAVAWRPFVIVLAGTGLRFGEATALRVRDVHLDNREPSLTVVQAWKHTDVTKEHRLGPPKSVKGRRTIGLSPGVVRTLRPLMKGKGADDLVLVNRQGNPIRHTSWWKRTWRPAVERAMATHDADGNEIPADQRLTKKPTPHDLRHSHASWLIAEGIPLTEIQYRLGHESIKTTSDLYGHLLPGHLSRSAAAIEIAMSQALPEIEES